jgi:ABC-type lipoprotein release transport system permease subunit
MKRNTLTYIVVGLFLVLAVLTIILMVKKGQQKAMVKQMKGSIATTVDPTAQPAMLTKKYQTEDGQFQFQYPESWFLVETSPQGAILASDASDTSNTDEIQTNGVKMRFQVNAAATGVHLNNFVQCDTSSSDCDIITFNDQPYKVTETTTPGSTSIQYETVRGTKAFEAKVIIGEGTQKKENIEILTAVLSTFYWK